MTQNVRLHFLDWLRVLAFGLLIVYHVGMLYVSWGYHIKSPRLVPGVEWLMVAVNPWRLALLFFISGVAASFLCDKLGPAAFARDRLRRLLPVLLFGMLVVVPPQSYLELRQDGKIAPGYLDFWLGRYLRGDQSLGITLPTWNHLWFLAYLVVYCLVFATSTWAAARRSRRGPASRLPTLALALAPGAWMALANVLAEERWPETRALVDDWAGHLRWAGLFALGVLVAKRPELWELLRRRTGAIVGAAAASLGLFLGIRSAIHAEVIGPAFDGVAYGLGEGMYGWLAMLCLMAVAARWWNRPSAALRYLTVAVLPVYALHQTLIIVTAWTLFPLRWPLAAEATAIVAATALGSLAIYELAIRRVAFLRALFGLRVQARSGPLTTPRISTPDCDPPAPC
jgi:fucose 4-O-acetylase-like acetyltransferase